MSHDHSSTAVPVKSQGIHGITMRKERKEGDGAGGQGGGGERGCVRRMREGYESRGMRGVWCNTWYLELTLRYIHFVTSLNKFPICFQSPFRT
jgi:hypothetical protein